jgi:alanyl-tRNA synthetase
MEKMGINEIREKFLSFYESKGHLRLPSFPLVPKGDQSLLLINSGMAPLKPYFKGEEEPPRHRVTTCQKCIRTPDIERVGKTARHGTFFEMLGNFSFGDYFKHEAIAWAWEFCTQVMKLPKDKLWVTVYEDDDETIEIWNKEHNVPLERIVRLGKEDNFWEIGTGPCGPCSEIYYDRGPEYSCGSLNCGVGCDCDRYVEFWNLVFTQFDSDGQGNYGKLAKPNIDTGMGLERLGCIMQGADNLFEVDTVKSIMKHVGRLSGIAYKNDKKSDVSLRVITDHIRSTTFMVCDGVLPSNEGRGYVLRKLLRRAARHGRLLGIKGCFLCDLCDTVINESKTAYPELLEKRDYIKKVILMEEEKFADTIDSGLSILKNIMDKLKEDGLIEITGEDAFRLYDTYGFPLDLTREIASDDGLTVDECGFDRLMQEQKEKSRAARAALGDFGWSGNGDIDLSGVNKTVFKGYEALSTESKVLVIIKDGESQSMASDGEKVTVVLDKTPFYGESGGQIGDEGIISTENGGIAVTDTQKTHDGVFLHMGTVFGELSAGDEVTAVVTKETRDAVMRNHSATHLLQKALQTILGSHIAQAGSLVSPESLRFDFSHFAALTQEEITAVENLVNNSILAGMPVNICEMSIEEAQKTGAMALFNEKYGDIVRVVNMGDYSVELCGGTHVDNTAKIGLFKIISESSVAAGVRRIEGVTGLKVLKLLNDKAVVIETIAETLKTNAAGVIPKAEQVMGEIKNLSKEINTLNSKMAAYMTEDMIKNADMVGGLSVITATVKGYNTDALKTMADIIKEKSASAVCVLMSQDGNKVNVVASAGKDAISKGAHSGNIVKAVAKILGGGGGGRPDIATAGGKNPSMMEQAIKETAGIIEGMLK